MHVSGGKRTLHASAVTVELYSMAGIGLGSAKGVLSSMKPLTSPPSFHSDIKSFYKGLRSRFRSNEGVLTRSVSVLKAANNIARQKGLAIRSLIDFTA